MNNEQRLALHVLERIKKTAEEDEFFANFLLETLDSLLDEYAADDGFGTEQQCDPRGDFRDHEWNIADRDVEGFEPSDEEDE